VERLTPRVVAGGITAVVAGGLMAALTASAGGLAGSLPGIVALTLTLVVAGATYGWLVDGERLSGGFGSGILFWTAALPAARLAQELLVGQGIPEGVMGFVVYQALVGGAFGLGFLLLQNQVSTLLLNVRAKRASAHGGRVDA
jgi:hypothetical protein